MAKQKLFTGIVLEGQTIKIAIISVVAKRLKLHRLDKYNLVDGLRDSSFSNDKGEDVFSEAENISDNSVFGMDLDADTSLEGDDILEEIDSDLDLGLDELEQGSDIIDIDAIDQSETPVSNELLLYNIFSSINPKRVDIGLNIPAGVAIYQILKDVDFSKTKKKDLQIIVDDRLESLYGTPKGEDYYSYGVRDDGALLLSSVDEDSQLLQLVNRTQNLYTGKIIIHDILPDETLLLGLLKANYNLDDDGFTCAIQFSETNSRIIFLSGSKLWLVLPIINEGINSAKILNTLFSKILFQLDTGEVPNLDRLILCNNVKGEESVSFFEKRFPDVSVTELEFSDDFIDKNHFSDSAISSFSTAIGMAWAASGFEKHHFPKITFLPRYIEDRQKTLKLQWHGILLLILIFASPLILNQLMQKNHAIISDLNREISVLDSKIEEIQPIVNNYNRINAELSQLQSKLILLDTLNIGSLTWSVNLNKINRGIQDINSIWITSMNPSTRYKGIEIHGYALYKDRIPKLAELFSEAVLQDVSAATIRGKDVYNFTYIVKEIVSNKSVYTPENMQGLNELIGK